MNKKKQKVTVKEEAGIKTYSFDITDITIALNTCINGNLNTFTEAFTTKLIKNYFLHYMSGIEDRCMNSTMNLISQYYKVSNADGLWVYDIMKTVLEARTSYISNTMVDSEFSKDVRIIKDKAGNYSFEVDTFIRDCLPTIDQAITFFNTVTIELTKEGYLFDEISIATIVDTLLRLNSGLPVGRVEQETTEMLIGDFKDDINAIIDNVLKRKVKCYTETDKPTQLNILSSKVLVTLRKIINHEYKQTIDSDDNTSRIEVIEHSIEDEVNGLVEYLKSYGYDLDGGMLRDLLNYLFCDIVFDIPVDWVEDKVKEVIADKHLDLVSKYFIREFSGVIDKVNVDGEKSFRITGKTLTMHRKLKVDKMIKTITSKTFVTGAFKADTGK